MSSAVKDSLMIYNRFIVCGDSYSEGMTDEVVNGQYRGWADRVADEMALHSPTFTYANLAIRGKLLSQVINDQVPVAMTYIQGPETLISFHAGANDAIRPGYDAQAAIAKYQQAVRELSKSGATLLLFTVLEDTGNKGRGSKIWKERFAEFNRGIREVGQEVGAIISDANGLDFFKDNRFLAFDRLHLNVEGHWRASQGVLEVLGYPFNPAWRTPLPPAKKTPWIKERYTGVLWFFLFALPWVWRRLQGKSSGDNRSAKYPAPIAWPRDI
jgi:lysophospholipase L1-like esterase